MCIVLEVKSDTPIQLEMSNDANTCQNPSHTGSMTHLTNFQIENTCSARMQVK